MTAAGLPVVEHESSGAKSGLAKAAEGVKEALGLKEA